MLRTFVIGDIHGAFKALKQVLEKVSFDYEKDTLISLGDIVDGWPESFECVEELLKIKNLISIRGNHDDVFLNYLEKGVHPMYWLHGGDLTLRSYAKNADRNIKVWPRLGGYDTDLTVYDIPTTHTNFFKNQKNYYIDKDKNVFVHGGFNRHEKIGEQDPSILLWDRGLFREAYALAQIVQGDNNLKFKDNISKVFVGHTPTTMYDISEPINYPKLINVDTGAGYGEGKLTIMNVETHEYEQSEQIKKLYPNDKGR